MEVGQEGDCMEGQRSKGVMEGGRSKEVPSNRVMSSQSGNVVTCAIDFCCCIARM